MGNIEPTKFKIQLEIQKERLKYAEERFRQQEQILTQAYKDLGQKETELKQLKSEYDDLRIKWEVLQSDFKHAQDSLKKDNQQNAKKKKAVRAQAFIASLLFLLSSILVNVGTTLFTSFPNSSAGWSVIALAATLYIIAALVTTLFSLERE